jgi:TetR/AcrR family transcriptional regulator
VLGDPTRDILAAAGRLFGELGVQATTMARLATEVGLRQSSLYYYFRSREQVVAALVAEANVVPLELIEGISAGRDSVASKLHRFIRGDVEALCALPFDINEIHRIAARDRERFAGYWSERATLERRLSTLLRKGMRDGQLRPVDARLVTITILANDEGTQNWYRLKPRRARQAALTLADLTVGGLLAGGHDLDEVRDESFRSSIETVTSHSRSRNPTETASP